MAVGPQRQGYPNLVQTAHGQTLSRRSDTAYTHAVVHSEPVSATRARLERTLQFHGEMVAKYGQDNIEDHMRRSATKAQKALEALPSSGHVSKVVSMHQSERQALARERRESNRGIGYSVQRVSQSSG